MSADISNEGGAPDQRTDSDCLRCCVAFAIGIPYEDVPDFVTEYDDRWSAEFSAWASSRGWTMVRFQTPRAGIRAMVPDGTTMWIADGPGPRGTDHAVVFRGEEMVHDPHPSRDGLSHAHGVTVLVRNADDRAQAQPPSAAVRKRAACDALDALTGPERVTVLRHYAGSAKKALAANTRDEYSP